MAGTVGIPDQAVGDLLAAENDAALARTIPKDGFVAHLEETCGEFGAARIRNGQSVTR